MRNLRLLVQSSAQHAFDDPALLMVQISRRLPPRRRVELGRLLERADPHLPGLGALGSVMAGRPDDAVRRLSALAETKSMTRLGGEVALLEGRPDLLASSAPASTRARAAWSAGDLTESVRILERAGAGDGLQARRLRSERALLSPDFHLPVPSFDRRSATSSEHRPLRILHLLTNSLPHTQSGYALRSHRILTALRDDGIESIALTRTGYPVMVGIPFARDVDVVDGIRYVRTLPPGLPRTQEERLGAEVAEALRLVKEFDPDVIHTTTNYHNALVAQALAEATGLPWVFEVRGLMEQTWAASHRTDEGRDRAVRSERYGLTAAKESELARAADAVVTLSQTMSEALGSRGAPPEKITLVPNGVEDALFEDHLDTATARRLTGLDEREGFGAGAYLVGAVSALVDYEGHDVLLRAAALVLGDESLPRELRDRLGVVLVGDGVSLPGLRALAVELGIADRVVLPGRVPRGDARNWVQALDLVAVPRRDVEVARSVTPQKPVEAMALGRPVVASDLPALREVLTAPDGRLAGELVPPESPEEWAAAIARRLIRKPVDHSADVLPIAQATARERTWTGLVRRYRDVYETVVRKKGGGAHGA